MKLAFRNEYSKSFEPHDLPAALDRCQKKQEYFLSATHTLLRFIQDFALDIKELKSDVFIKNLDELEAKFNRDEKLRRIQSSFRRHQKRIRKFIDRQKRYLAEREKELKDIIDLLAKAMVTLDSDNQHYNQKIFEQSEKIEQITRLDDIKKVKQALIYEIENIRQTIRNKQDRDGKQLKILSKQVSALNHELEKAKVDSVTDGLTGIYNRKAFDRYIRELISKNNLTKTSFAILMIDIDNFKTVNDSYGHQTGDRALLALAHKCRSLIRHEDFIARYGGEEFVILLPNASLRNAVKKARLICKTISDTHYSLNDIKADHILSLTVSIGVSVYQKGDTAKSVIDRADQALYAAKHNGKNRVATENELILT